jgi:hypothetical protein
LNAQEQIITPDGNPLEGVPSSTATSQAADLQREHFHSTLFKPLMTLSSTPPPGVALITAALMAMGIPDPSDPKKVCSWAAAFNEGRQAVTVAVIDDKGATKALPALEPSKKAATPTRRCHNGQQLR